MVNRQTLAWAWRRLNGKRRRTRRCSNVMSGVGCNESAIDVCMFHLLWNSKVNENVSNVMTMNDIVDSAYH